MFLATVRSLHYACWCHLKGHIRPFSWPLKQQEAFKMPSTVFLIVIYDISVYFGNGSTVNIRISFSCVYIFIQGFFMYL